MPQIDQIAPNIQTGDLEDAGTDGDIYLGVCGREFYVDSQSDDFERGAVFTYIFGDGANVSNPPPNDPRSHLLLTENVERFPTYIRFQPENRNDHWFMQDAEFSFNGQILPQWGTSSFLRRGIWLGTRSGMYVHLPMHLDPRPQ